MRLPNRYNDTKHEWIKTMKITKQQLRQIIKEELSGIYEADEGAKVLAAIKDVPVAAQQIAKDVTAQIEKLSATSGLDPLVLAQAVSALLTVKK